MAQGQLWYQLQGGFADERIVRVNNDGSGQTTVVDDSAGALPSAFGADIGLDTARGFYFAIYNNGPLAQNAVLARGSLSGGAPTTLVNFAQANTGSSPFDANPIVSALFVDPISRRIFVGIQDEDGNDNGTRSGIRSYSYDDAGNLTDNGFLVLASATNKPTELGGFKLFDVNDLAFDRATGNLYFTESGNGGTSGNYTGLFRVNINNPNVVTQVISQTQFPDSGVNGIIRDVDIDTTRNHVFFSTRSVTPIDGNNYDANDNAIWVTALNGAGNQTATRVTLTGAPANFYPDDMTFDATTNQLYVETEGANGSNTDDVILVFQLSADGTTGSLIRTITPAASSNVINIGGLAFNDLPDVAAGTTIAYVENGGPTTVLSNATITDGDGLVRGATVQLTTNFNAATDSLTYTTQSGISGSYNSATGLLTLSGIATAASYQAAIRSIRFAASGDNPTATRGVTITVDDGSPAVPAGSTNSITATFGVTAVNDAPVFGNLNGDTAAATSGAAAVLLDAGGNATVSDLDSTNFDSGRLTVALATAQDGDALSVQTGGSITSTGNTVAFNGVQFATYTGVNSGTLTFTFDPDATPAAVQALVRQIAFQTTSQVAGTRNVNFTLVDGDGTANNGADTALAATTVLVTVPNTPPTGTDATLTAAEDTALTLTFANFGTSDSDGTVTGIRIATLPAAASGTLYIDTDGAGGSLGTAVTAGQVIPRATFDANQVVFVPAANATVGTSFTFAAQDNLGAFDASPNTITLNITPVNDAPALGGAGNTVGYVENAAGMVIAGGLTVSDVDSVNLTGATVSIAGRVNGDQLNFTNGGGITGLYDAGTGVLTLGGTASVAAYQAALRSVTFSSSSDNPGAGARTISFTATDGTTPSGPVTATVTVTPVNDAPSGADGTVAATEDTRLVLTAANFGFTDVDGNAFDAVRITTVPANGNLYFDSDGAGGSLGQLLVANDIVGIATINAGQLVFIPNADFTGSTGFTFQVRDNGGVANGGSDLDASANTLTITVEAVDDAPVAVADTGTVAENATLTGQVLTNDTDVDGGLKAIAAVNGQVAGVGQPVTLASGAILTLNADGTYSYNPNGKFDYLVSPATAAATGAQNGSATDTFTYTLNGGSTASVTVTITGIDGANQELRGGTGNDSLMGTPQADVFDLSQGGDDVVDGLASNDSFFFGAAFTAADRVDGGAGANDQIGLRGNYTGATALTLGATTIANVEVIAVLPGFSYAITTVDANVVAGQTLSIYGGQLGTNDSFTFNGAAETDLTGNVRVYGGAGTDIITTGAGNDDGIYFGPGKFDPTRDRVDGGTGSNDQLALDGNYAITLDGTAIRNIDVIALQPGVPGDLATYALTLDDSLVATGQTITLWGQLLDTVLTVNGAAETSGSLKVYGGHLADTITTGGGADLIWGGLGGDTLNGGGGADTFLYDAVEQSRSGGYDRIVAFDDSIDKIDLPFTVTGFAAPASGNLDAASLDVTLQAAFAGLTANQAGVFTATGGDMNGRTFLVVDADGVAGYQAGSDYLIEMVTPVSPIDQPVMFI